jgi:hypothetical protein
MKPVAYFLITFLSITGIAVCGEPDDEINGDVVRDAAKLWLDKHLRQGINPRDLSGAWGRQFARSYPLSLSSVTPMP